MTLNPYKRQVKNVMSKVVVSAAADGTLHDAITLMHENRLSTLPVVDQRNRCVGMISASDLIEVARDLEQEISDLGRVSEVSRRWLLDMLTEHDLGSQQLSTRMSAVVMSVSPEADLTTAAAEMLRHRVHHLPVLDEQRHLLGIVSTMDLLTAFVEGSNS